MIQPSPHDIQAEMAVLGAMLLSPVAVERAKSRLHKDDFYRLSHQDIYEALLQTQAETGSVDIVLVQDALQRMGNLEQAGGLSYLLQLQDSVTIWQNVEWHVSIVRRQSAKRSLMELCRKAALESQAGTTDVNVLAESIREALDGWGRTDYRIPLIAEHLTVATERMEKRARGEETALTTGIRPLDRQIGGLEPGDYMVICAATSVGKTALANNILLDVTVQQGKSALFFSAEVIGPTLAVDLQRILCRLDFWSIQHGKLLGSNYQRWKEGAAKLETAKLWVDDTSGIPIEDLVARAQEMCRKKDIALIVVDYIQLLRLLGGRGES